MRRVLAALLLTLACEPTTTSAPDAAGPKETNCVDGADDDKDGKVDCADEDCASDTACKPPEPKPCGKQADCGDIVNEIVTKTCLNKKCVPPGSQDRKGEPETVDVIFDVSFDTAFSQTSTQPKSGLLRFVYGELADGGKLTCASLKALSGETQDTRSKLDSNPAVNQIFRNLITLNWSSAQSGKTTFANIPGLRIPKAKAVLFYGEAWYGTRELNNPQGNRASTDCVEGIDLEATARDTHFALNFRP